MQLSRNCQSLLVTIGGWVLKNECSSKNFEKEDSSLELIRRIETASGTLHRYSGMLLRNWLECVFFCNGYSSSTPPYTWICDSDCSVTCSSKFCLPLLSDQTPDIWTPAPVFSAFGRSEGGRTTHLMSPCEEPSTRSTNATFLDILKDLTHPFSLILSPIWGGFCAMSLIHLVGEFPSWRVVVSEVGDRTDIGLFESRVQLGASFVELVLNLLRGLVSDTNRNDHHLVLSHPWRNDQTLVVGMDHHHDTNNSGRKTPRRLMCIYFRMLWTKRVLNRDVEHLGEVLAEVVRGGTLNTPAGGWDVSFASGGVQTSGKLLVLSLNTLYDRNSKQFLVNARIKIQDLADLLASFLLGEVCCMALLPQELSGSEEWLRVLEFPSNHRVPLVELQWQISVRTDPFGIVRIHDGFTCWSDSNWLLQVRRTGSCHPSDLRSKSFDVVLLLLKNSRRHKHREVRVGDAVSLDFVVKPSLDLLPNSVGRRTQDVTSRHIVIIKHFSLGQDLLIPAREITFLINGHADQLGIVDLGFGLGLRLGDSWIVDTFLHVERLDLNRESGKQNRDTNGVGHFTLCSFSDIVSKLEFLTVLVWNAVLVQPVQGLNVLHTLERQLRSHKSRVQLLHQRTSSRVFQHVLNGLGDNSFDVTQQVIKCHKSQLGFNMCVLTQVSSSVRLFRPERLLDTIDVSQSRKTGLQIQLRGLRQERLLAIVVHFE
ncbi:hypothetical protein OGATHE_003753 [Ogataea polymorpha]|uniref:Uncharacterized protein n=1 Tax=Ogataea polymorpha TaxID=460523 RepID=A0A9P8T3I8_9ASCO|nr:hypothetical protein OGATHE_003753 [Ogataea polymorpha]